MPIKNYTTKKPAPETVGEIQSVLAKYGANKIMFEYEAGKPIAILFQVDTQYGNQAIRIAPNVNGCMAALQRDKVKCDMDHAESVAWRTQKDWIEAQMAIIDAEQAELAQIFLPYTVANYATGTTVFDLYKSKRLALPEPDEL